MQSPLHKLKLIAMLVGLTVRQIRLPLEQLMLVKVKVMACLLCRVRLDMVTVLIADFTEAITMLVITAFRRMVNPFTTKAINTVQQDKTPPLHNRLDWKRMS